MGIKIIILRSPGISDIFYRVVTDSYRMRIGIVACDILEGEIEQLTANDPDFTERVYLEFALHVDPAEMRKEIVRQVWKMIPKVDAVLLGYAVCNSLDGIENEFDKPVVKLPGADCIDALLTTDEYNREKKICLGTWFNSPGWAKEGVPGLIKEMHLDSVEDYPPEFFLDMLFGSYERVLFIDTGIGDADEYERMSREMAKSLKLDRHDCRRCDLHAIEDAIREVKSKAGGA